MSEPSSARSNEDGPWKLESEPSSAGSTDDGPWEFEYSPRGPLAHYLAATSQQEGDFLRALREGNSNAVVLFAAELIFMEIRRIPDARGIGGQHF